MHWRTKDTRERPKRNTRDEIQIVIRALKSEKRRGVGKKSGQTRFKNRDPSLYNWW